MHSYQTPRANPKKKRIKLTGKAKTELRKSLHWRAAGYCESCGERAPLLDPDNQFDIFTCGHTSHIKSVGAGGDDSMENTKWSCPSCHFAEHGPQWGE